MDTGLYLLHSLRRGGAMAAYRVGTDHIAIKHHGLWASYAFWLYVTSPCVSNSSVAAALPAAMD